MKTLHYKTCNLLKIIVATNKFGNGEKRKEGGKVKALAMFCIIFLIEKSSPAPQAQSSIKYSFKHITTEISKM